VGPEESTISRRESNVNEKNANGKLGIVHLASLLKDQEEWRGKLP